MNDRTEKECLPNFELKFNFLENLRIPLTLKSTKRKGIEKKNKSKMADRDEGRKPNESSYRGKPNKRRERKQNRYQCRKKSSIYSGKANHFDLYR